MCVILISTRSLVNSSGQTPYKLSLKMMQESGLIDAIGLGVTLKGTQVEVSQNTYCLAF